MRCVIHHLMYRKEIEIISSYYRRVLIKPSTFSTINYDRLTAVVMYQYTISLCGQGWSEGKLAHHVQEWFDWQNYYQIQPNMHCDWAPKGQKHDATSRSRSWIGKGQPGHQVSKACTYAVTPTQSRPSIHKFSYLHQQQVAVSRFVSVQSHRNKGISKEDHSGSGRWPGRQIIHPLFTISIQ